MRKLILFFLMMLIPLSVCAGDGESGKKQPFIVKGVMWVKTLIDSMAVATVDRSYIEQPKKPWAIEVRTDASENSLKMTSEFPRPNGGVASLTAETSTGFSTSAGLWLGYRGYGFGWSKDLTGEGTTFSLGAMGGSFGINFRINTYRSDTPDVTINYSSTEKSYDETGKAELDDPIRVRSLFLDGYYMFNGKHFSYAAAYDQSLIQRKSAGSLMAGLMYYHTSVSFDDKSNWPLVAFMKNIGKLKFSQASVGAGYAYNWVPARGWLVNVMVMPMLQFYNSISAYAYRFYEDGIDITDDIIIDFNDGKDEDVEYGEIDESNLELRMGEVYKTNNRIGFNFDARLAVVYNWNNCYLRLFGHYNRFPYHNDKGNGRLAEWRAYAAVGFRF